MYAFLCIPMYVTIWLGQKHVGKELAAEITPNFTEKVV